MGGSSDDLENLAFVRSLEFYKQRIKARSKEKTENHSLGTEIVNFIFKDDRAETSVEETIEKFFSTAIQNLSADPEGNMDLIYSVQSIISNKMFRVEHPRLRKLLQLDYEMTFFETLGKHSQIERAIENEVAAETAKKTRISTLVASIKKAFGTQSNPDSDWIQ